MDRLERGNWARSRDHFSLSYGDLGQAHSSTIISAGTMQGRSEGIKVDTGPLLATGTGSEGCTRDCFDFFGLR